MRILVTGANGFIGKNLIHRLKNNGYDEIDAFTHDMDEDALRQMCKRADFVVHLAGVNRPENEEEFRKGNTELTEKLLNFLREENYATPVILSSSIQAGLDNPYGISKRLAEEAVDRYGREENVRVYIYRMPNVFGKWSRPEYNSAIATFCHNIARGLPIRVDDASHKMKLLYIDDIVAEFADRIKSCETERPAYVKRDSYVEPAESPVYETTLGEIAEKIKSFRACRENLNVPDLSDELTSKLYSTYLSFLPTDGFMYDLKMNVDNRGSFTEFLRSYEQGQVSVNISHPGITKGQHWHDSKNEKFLVVRGRGLIRFRRIDESEIYEYHVSGEKLQVVEIPTGYTHCIINEGDEDMVTVMWANEPFNPARPDTYYEEV